MSAEHLDTLWAEMLAAIGARQWDEALAVIQKLDIQGWRQIESRTLKILVLREKGRFDEARSIADAYIEEVSDYPRIWIERALICFGERDWSRAESEFQTIRDRFPLEYEAYLRGAEIARELGKSDDACYFLSRGIELFPTRKDLLHYFAKYSEETGSWRRAYDLWSLHRSRFPSDKAGYLGALLSLRKMKLADRATALLEAAVEAFPQDIDVLCEYAEEASKNLDWQEALRRWKRAKQNHPNASFIDDRLGEVNWHIRLDNVTEAETPYPVQHYDGEIESQSAIGPAHRDLMMRFESLGDNCEFGLVQRHFGAEPISLYRWSGILLDALIEAIRIRFEGLGDPAHTKMSFKAGTEYVVNDDRGFLEMHTFIKEDSSIFERTYRQQCRRLVYLRDQLLSELKASNKIFIFKPRNGTFRDKDIENLHRALRSIGNAKLMCVRVSSGVKDRGILEDWGDGLLVGNISSVSAGARKDEIKYGEWLSICEAAAK